MEAERRGSAFRLYRRLEERAHAGERLTPDEALRVSSHEMAQYMCVYKVEGHGEGIWDHDVEYKVAYSCYFSRQLLLSLPSLCRYPSRNISQSSQSAISSICI